MTDIDSLAATLDAHPDYRVLRRFEPRTRYADDSEAADDKRLGIFVDVETTGLDPRDDRIIELALVPFGFTSDGKVYEVHDAFDELQDPGRPIPAFVSTLTGITDAMVRGHAIDGDTVNRLVEPAHVVIAHNAEFDRRFVEAVFPVFATKAWACTATQLPWNDEGLASYKLEYLAYHYGFFYEGHRAAIDCQVGIEILTRQLPASHRPVLATMLDAARESGVRILAIDSPYERKELLKARGYRWNNGDDGQPAAWYVDVPASQEHAELDWLASNIYGGHVDLPTRRVTAFNRFSNRI